MILEKKLSVLGDDQSSFLFKLLFPIAGLMMILSLSVFVLLKYGVEVWGINVPVAWGFAIVNFVWWIGIGHAGTFISAILLLVRQDWRNSINRIAESMTLFAVASAGIFPLLHMGRPWYAYWLLPYPNDMTLSPQYRSPLVWDAFAVSTYILVSLIFWYVGLIPDFAVAREQTDSKPKRILFGILSLGFSGELREWASFKKASQYFAIIATPLVISVHTVVSLDFTGAQTPGWHSPLFPPFFVTGAIYSGFAMVICLLIMIRHKFPLKDIVSPSHLESCAKFLLMSGMIVTFFYVIEFFIVWYGDEFYESKIFINRMFGVKSWAFWLMLVCNSVVVQLLWVPKIRKSETWLFIISVIILIGMWMERYVIVISSLMDTPLASTQGYYAATIWDWGLYIGSFGIFAFGLWIVLRFLPFIPITEVKELEHK